MRSLKNNIYFKMGAIVIIILLLLIPTAMIKDLVREREDTQAQAIREVSDKWAREQTITGPMLTIPYRHYVVYVQGKDTTHSFVRDYIHVLPEKLEVRGTVEPEKRKRGIYEIVVYNSKLHFSGTFAPIDLAELDIKSSSVEYNKAVLTLGISDLRGIENQVTVNWNDDLHSFNPGVVSDDVIESGINTPVSIGDDGNEPFAFTLDMDLKGSQRLYFAPVGKVTDVYLESDWTNPSYNGAFLPDARSLSDTGFVADWNVLHLNRNFPQQWKGPNSSVEDASFGVDLLLPVDRYLKTMRSVKYAMLMVILTFMVFFFVEVMRKVFIHPVQYILVGISLVVFYTLLLSLSEHMGFNIAYLISMMATLLLIVGYVKAILHSNQLVALVGGILVVLYAFVFVIIQLQDYALLMGSIGMFLILALVMYLSRKIDWYALNMEERQ